MGQTSRSSLRWCKRDDEGFDVQTELLGSHRDPCMEEKSLVVFDFDGTLSRGATICEVLAESQSRLPRMQEIERLKTKEDITAAREEMAPWHAEMKESDIISSLQNINLAPGVEEGLMLLRNHGVTIAIASITCKFAISHFAKKWNIEHFIGTDIFAATSQGLYFSTDNGVSFNLFNTVLNPAEPRTIIESSFPVSYFAGKQSISVIDSGVRESTIPLYNNKSIYLNDMGAWGTYILLGTSSGLYISADSGNTFSFAELFCGTSATALPSGSVEFNGFNNTSSAVIKFSEIAFDVTGKQWVELTTESSGSLGGFAIVYLRGNDEEQLFEFPNINVNSGDKIVVYLDPDSATRYSLSAEIYTGNLSFFSTLSELSLSDGVLALRNGKEWHDVLFFSNLDGHISSSFMNNGMRRLYRISEGESLYPFNSIFPISGFNDTNIQIFAENINNIPNAGSLQKNLNTWQPATIASPGY